MITLQLLVNQTNDIVVCDSIEFDLFYEYNTLPTFELRFSALTSNTLYYNEYKLIYTNDNYKVEYILGVQSAGVTNGKYRLSGLVLPYEKITKCVTRYLGDNYLSALRKVLPSNYKISINNSNYKLWQIDTTDSMMIQQLLSCCNNNCYWCMDNESVRTVTYDKVNEASTEITAEVSDLIIKYPGLRSESKMTKNKLKNDIGINYNFRNHYLFDPSINNANNLLSNIELPSKFRTIVVTSYIANNSIKLGQKVKLANKNLSDSIYDVIGVISRFTNTGVGVSLRLGAL